MTMNIRTYKREQIEEGILEARRKSKESGEAVRLLFSPVEISSKNFEETCLIFSRLNKEDYDTVVIIDTHTGSSANKLPMPSFKSIHTTLGEISANDRLRNEFADEDDDFFVDDEAFDDEVSLYDQLMMLQTVLTGFDLLFIQITDENSFIVKELAFAIEEILRSKNVLVVFCCELDSEYVQELKKVKNLVDSGNESGLMHYLNSGDSHVRGVGSFVAGLLVAKKWGLHIHFSALAQNNVKYQNLIGGYAVMKPQPVYG